MSPELFFCALLLVPFVDTMTTMLNEKLTDPVNGSYGGASRNVKDFKNILSYSPLIILEKRLSFNGSAIC